MHPLIVIGGYQIPAYSFCAFIAAILGMVIAIPALKRVGLPPQRSLPLLLMVCLAFMVGARLWNVAVNPWNFIGERHWYSPRMFGLSLYGGFLGALLALLLLLRLWKRPIWPVLDAFVVPCGLAFCIARVGCFLNGCCAGKATDSALGVVFPSQAASQQALAQLLPFIKTGYAVHPTQLYELVGALIGLPLAICLTRRMHLHDGGRFLLYAVWFSSARLAVLPLRVLTYSAPVKGIVYPALYIALILGGIALLLFREKKTTNGIGTAAFIECSQTHEP